MRKENRHPNQPSRSKKYSNKTPDSMSSRGTFKPKFIVKEPIKNEELMKSQLVLDEMFENSSPVYDASWKHKYQALQG